MKIEKFEKKHLTQVISLSKTIFENGWTEKQFEQELSKPNSANFVLTNQNDVIGFIFTSVSFDTLEILDLGIAKNFQGHGYAKLLVQQVFDFCEDNFVSKIFLEVNTKNIRAINLYQSFGFQTNRVRKNYYGTDDCFEMILDLKS